MSFAASCSRISNPLLAKQLEITLQDPIFIDFTRKWAPGNTLYDWYTQLLSRLIRKIQLRKERESPWFHEFIVIEFNNTQGPSYFRIDRRQSPTAPSPMDCIYDKGCQANDTIEEVTAFNADHHGLSDCIVEIDFKLQVHLSLVLRICYAIHQNSATRVYTIQRYNCYFFSRTILRCVARQGWCMCMGRYREQRENRVGVALRQALAPLKVTPIMATEDSKELDLEKRSSFRLLSEPQMCRNACDQVGEDPSFDPQPGIDMTIYVKAKHIIMLPSIASLEELAYIPIHVARLVFDNIEPASYEDLHADIEAMIQEHSERVGWYWSQFMTGETAEEFNHDIKQAMDDVWYMVRTCPGIRKVKLP